MASADSSPASRRALLHGGALAALAGALTALPAGAQDKSGMTIIQAFACGTLFPTQGDADSPPYTLILWGADDRGLLALTAEWAAVLNSGALLAALEAGAAPQAALVLPAPADGTGQQQAWGLTLVSGSPGSDPDAVTYQGDLLADAAASDWLGTPVTAPEGAATFGPGYLVLIGLDGLDISENASVRIALG